LVLAETASHGCLEFYDAAASGHARLRLCVCNGSSDHQHKTNVLPVMLELILQKLGLKSIDELKPLERETWRQWATILGKPDITIEDLKKLLPIEIARAHAEAFEIRKLKGERPVSKKPTSPLLRRSRKSSSPVSRERFPYDPCSNKSMDLIKRSLTKSPLTWTKKH